MVFWKWLLWRVQLSSIVLERRASCPTTMCHQPSSRLPNAWQTRSQCGGVPCPFVSSSATSQAVHAPTTQRPGMARTRVSSGRLPGRLVRGLSRQPRQISFGSRSKLDSTFGKRLRLSGRSASSGPMRSWTPPRRPRGKPRKRGLQRELPNGSLRRDQSVRRSGHGRPELRGDRNNREAESAQDRGPCR